MPVVTPETSVAEALVEITQKGLGMTAVVAPDSTVLGIFTDGDLRRVIDQRFDINTTSISEVMTTQCTMVNANILAADALRIMQDGKFNALLVIDSERRLTGVLNMHDLLRSRVF